MDSALLCSYPNCVLSRKGKCSTGRFSFPPLSFHCVYVFRHLLRVASINIYLFIGKRSWSIDLSSAFGAHQYWSFLKVNTRCHVTTSLHVLSSPCFSGSAVNLDGFVKYMTTILFHTSILVSLGSIQSYCMLLSEASIFLWFLWEVISTEVAWISRLFPRSVYATIQINRIYLLIEAFSQRYSFSIKIPRLSKADFRNFCCKVNRICLVIWGWQTQDNRWWNFVIGRRCLCTLLCEA